MNKEQLTKEEFIKYMSFLKRQYDYEDKLFSLTREYRDVVGDAEAPMSHSSGVIIELLEKLLDLPKDEYGYSDLSWWVWETDFGETFEIGSLENTNFEENHKYRKPDLSDLDKLCDYLFRVAEIERMK